MSLFILSGILMIIAVFFNTHPEGEFKHLCNALFILSWFLLATYIKNIM